MDGKSGVRLGGKYIVECYDKDGKLKWIDLTRNIVTNEGLDRILNTVIKGTTQITTWYAGLANSNTTATATMTYDVPIFTESTGYDGATRPTYTVIPSIAQSLTNAAAKATFVISTTATMYGAALFSQSTKGDHPAGADNVLLSYAAFATARAVVDDDTINLTYTLSGADDGV